MKLKAGAKIIIILLVISGAIFGIKKWQSRPQEVKTTQLLGKVSVPDAPEASLTGAAAVKLDLPSSDLANNNGLKITINEMAWQSQNGYNYANGGTQTTKGSLFDKIGLNVDIVRQDNCTQSCTDLAKWIKDYHDGTTKDGMIIIFMGSGIPAYIHGISEAVKALGPEYQPVAFLTTGKSYGEDQVIGPIEVKNNPQLLKGKVLRGVRLDGDIDLMLKFAGDNGVKINPNDKLYDYDALNLSYAESFTSAVVDYNTNKTETRKIVRNGKTTGQDTTVGYDLVATWTPGDVTAIQGKGGVTIISTKEYGSVMPNIAISCKKFLNDNRTKIEDMIASLATAGDQIKSFDDAKKYVSQLNTKIWNEQTPDYWYKYYNGVKYNENTHLGGSMVFNLADMAKEFGINGSGPDIYREIYNTFGTVQSKLYPSDLPTFVDYSKAVDKSFIMSVVSNRPELLQGKPLEVTYADKITTKIASKNVQINFATGSAQIQPSSYDDLDNIISSAVTAEGLKVGVYGHTDNTGNPDKNLILSEQRADAVKNYLIEKGHLQSNRIESKGYGDSQPIESNATSGGKAKNRRVQIVLGN